MLSFHLDVQGFDDAVTQFAAIAYRLFDLRPLAVRIAEIMVQQNAVNRSLGLDRNGVPFWDLAPSTMRKRERQGRLGPPLAPDGSASPIVGMFKADIEVAHPDDITIRGHWPGLPWVGYHTDNADARSRLPVRDPAGMPADAQDLVAEAFEDFLAGLLAQTY